MFIKKLSSNEMIVYDCLSELDLNDITIPFKISKEVLIMEKGEHFSRLDLDFVQLYYQCLSKLYKYKNAEFSNGIYSFFSSGIVEKTELSYLDYLKDEIYRIIMLYEKNLFSGLYDVYFNSKSIFENSILNFYNFKECKTYSLLHGDLFLGNILRYQGKYKLIDFEFIRFGLIEMELAFLLCWDFISNASLCKFANKTINKNINSIVISGIINENSKLIIKELFIPMFIMIACIFVSNGKFVDTNSFVEGILEFSDKYLDMF